MNTDITNPPRRTVRLYGKLGTQFGRVHELCLDSGTPREALAALMSQHNGLQAFLTQAKSNGMGFAVFIGKRNIGEDRLNFPANDDIRIAPVILGSKNDGALFEIVLGVALVAVGFSDGGLTVAQGAALISAGTGLAAGGVVQLLTPTPKLNKPGENPANTPSYLFNGPINTEAQGHPVPVFYGGPMKIGSAVISAGIDDADTAYAPQPPGYGNMGGGHVFDGILKTFPAQ